MSDRDPMWGANVPPERPMPESEVAKLEAPIIGGGAIGQALKAAAPRTPAGRAYAGLDSLRWMLNNVHNAGTPQFEAFLSCALQDADDAADAIAELVAALEKARREREAHAEAFHKAVILESRARADLAASRFGEREWRDRARDMERERDEALRHGMTLIRALKGYARKIRAIAEGVSGG